MGAPAAAGGGDGDDDVVFEYLLCTEDAASAGSFQQLQGPAPAVSSSPSTTTTAPAAAGSCDDGGEEEEEVWTVDVVAELIGGEAERSHSPRADYPGRLRSCRPADLAARANSVAWILKIDTRYIFEPRTIFRMELLVLDALDWRLRSITPFTFMYLFAFKVDPNGKHIRELIHQATQVTLATIHDTEFLDHCPSSIAAAAVLCASSEIMQLVSTDHGTLVSWRIIGLDEEAIIRCYRLMQQLISSNNVGRESTEITMATTRTTMTATTAVSSEEVVSSSLPSKRRKMSPGT
uniref:Cyclin C-terminal domain-containing protein n=1 Tax=Oryza meridionalis TaxID=40149 RepID=A0A0E0ELK0_9ORYZ